ncbi:hypothetical protein EDB84DRAFT_1682081 [Lactarius hengduanensis]|nr:hypothetical protein EDB84DRAFT_1682081 [Lactarius hengduanensis]
MWRWLMLSCHLIIVHAAAIIITTVLLSYRFRVYTPQPEKMASPPPPSPPFRVHSQRRPQGPQVHDESITNRNCRAKAPAIDDSKTMSMTTTTTTTMSTGTQTA